MERGRPKGRKDSKPRVLLSDKEREKLVLDFKLGYSYRHLVKKYGVCEPTIRRAIKAISPGTIKPANRLKGSVDDVIEMRKDKKNYQQIATKLGVSRERVRQILEKHAPGLVGWGYIKPGYRDPHFCSKCKCELTKKSKNKYCTACYKVIKHRVTAANFILREHLLVNIIKEMRTDGATWHAIGKQFFPNCNYPAIRAIQHVKLFDKHERMLRGAKW